MLKEFEIGLCDNCVQSTNHLNGICQKCKDTEEWGDRKYPAWADNYPLNTFTGQTKEDLVAFVLHRLEQQKKQIFEDCQIKPKL